MAVHDCWGSYFGFQEMKHALCNAHILRELNGIIETGEAKWAVKMKELLLEMYRKSDFGKGIIEEIRRYEKSYEKILRAGEKARTAVRKKRRTRQIKADTQDGIYWKD